MKRYLQRGWWKPWNWSTGKWLLALFAAVVVSPTVMRWICLWQVPDVSLPFDARDVIGPTVPKERDALTCYMSAAERLNHNSPDWLPNAMADAAGLNGPWDERLDQWLMDNSKLFEEIEMGTSRDAVSKSLSRNFEANLSVWGALRNLRRGAATRAQAFERYGKLDEAWKWHRLSLQVADHTDRMESLVASLVCIAIRNSTLESIRQWASHPSLTGELLSRARRELTQLTIHRTPISQIMKSEYLEFKDALESEYGPDILFPELDNAALAHAPVSNAKRFLTWSMGEPEVSLRLLRQVLVNNLDQVDQPIQLRRRIIRQNYPVVFDHDPGKSRRSGQLSATQLDRILDGPQGVRLIKLCLFFRLGQAKNISVGIEDIYLLHYSRIEMTIVVLAANEFQRVHGAFPANVKQLIPVYLETEPLDPMSRTGEQLQYRVDESGNAWVWTVGVDGLTEEAAINPNSASENCFKISLSNGIDGER